jgi:threonine/homoserine/homoserine lactone efflux protein
VSGGGWGTVFGELIPLALVVAASPVSIIPAVMLVLQSDRPRPTGLAFLVGWTVGLIATTAVFVQLPRLLDGFDQPAPRWSAWVRIAAGAVLIALGVWRWATRHRSTAPPSWLNRLSRVTPIAAFALGAGLILVNPKVLLMNAAAGLVIGTAAWGLAGTWLAVVYYSALAASTVAVPTLAYVVAGDRVDRALKRLKDWMERQHAALMAGILLAVGLLLLFTGFRAL